MKSYAVILLLTGIGLLTACGAANPAGTGSTGSLSDSESRPAETEKNTAELFALDTAEADDTDYSLPDLNSFTARTLDGGSFTAADLSGADLTVINIWSTTCGPCIREMPELAEFAAGLPDTVRVMTWCIDAEYSPDAANIGQFLDDCGFHGITLTSGDGDMETFLEELQYTPTTVFLDSSGNLLSEPLIGAGDIETQYTVQINAGLKKLGKETLS